MCGCVVSPGVWASLGTELPINNGATTTFLARPAAYRLSHSDSVAWALWRGGRLSGERTWGEGGQWCHA